MLPATNMHTPIGANRTPKPQSSRLAVNTAQTTPLRSEEQRGGRRHVRPSVHGRRCHYASCPRPWVPCVHTWHLFRPYSREVGADRLHVPACRRAGRHGHLRHEARHARRDDHRHDNGRGRQAHVLRQRQRLCDWLGHTGQPGGRLQHGHWNRQHRLRKAFRRRCGGIDERTPPFPRFQSGLSRNGGGSQGRTNLRNLRRLTEGRRT